MKRQFYSRIKRESVVLMPGAYFATAQGDEVISTLLGSCVAACLYDPLHKVIGMNHFLLSSAHYAKNMSFLHTDAGRYGAHAMELLINDMLKLGADRRYIQAKAFGGGKILDMNSSNYTCVSDKNVEFIIEYLRVENIKLVAQALGGRQGRVIHFFASDYSVLVRNLRPQQAYKQEIEEYEYWQKTVQKTEKSADSNVVLFD